MARCDSYYPGQCTAGACQLNGWVEDGWGNGGQWAASAAGAGFTITSVPTVGAVVCYAEGDGYSEFGHVATVTAVHADGTFEVDEENYIGPFVWDNRSSSTYDVAGFILPPGVSPGAAAPAAQGQGAGPPTGAGANAVSGAWAYFATAVSTDLPNLNGELTEITGWLNSA